MPHVPTVEPETATPEQRRLLEEIVRDHGSATNMKRTLVHSQVALDALLTWYPLYREARTFLGERATTLFCYAISTRNSCLLCTTFFRHDLIVAGEDPADFRTDEREDVIIAFGAQLAADANGVDDELFARLSSYFTPEQIVTLTGFGALMIATNVFNSALGVEVDEHLLSYRPPTVATGA